MRALSLALCLLPLLAACQRPPTPDRDKPPEPQALRQAVNAPLDRAKGVQKTVDDAAKREQQAAADAQ
ncbi:hypothetical protein [Stenotrophomonas sp. 24(2023)]|uniref:hypothetical protein n=1 Tax=Stenotrophomonas sp. 24(2023) TaxID=3068324 RepID=UPI0027E0BB0D|nr:hypothetical protein [Stenotrophomonas sp. 24(2023)]WMJ70666.1 hypothetical protein Q9R17_06080 [Stenotrophomonas sp. 24(2023)]